MISSRFCKFCALALLSLVNTKADQGPRILYPLFERAWVKPFHHEKGNYFEGDIIVPSTRFAGSYAPRWKNGTIPYIIQSSINQRGRQAILAAMQDIETKTCIRFKPRSSRRPEKDYVYMTMYNEGCYAYVGRNGGKQQLNLGPGCWSKTTIIHELMHSIGFWHEQSRQDRDKWVSIQWNNIPTAYWKEFNKYSKLYNFNTEYDYSSVMHYSYNAFARNYRRPTIIPKDKTIQWRRLGSGDKFGGLTETDALQIDRMYGCRGDQDYDYFTSNQVI